MYKTIRDKIMLILIVGGLIGCQEQAEYKWSFMNAPTFLYKVATKQQWSDMQAKGMSYEQGSDLDKQDGFLHLSTAKQVERVAMKYFSGLKDGYLIQIEFAAIKDSIKWEPNSKGEDFPHAYEVIPSSAILKAYDFSTTGFDFKRLDF